MYESIATFELQPGKMDEALSLLQDDVVSRLKRQKGMLGLCLLPDRCNDKLVVISLWQSQDDSNTLEVADLFQKLNQKLDGLLLHPITLPMFENWKLAQAYSHCFLN
jgi:quinol monooxygenase YgiN